MKLGHFRTCLYRGARRTGDVQAVLSGSPRKVAKRVARKKLGRRYGALAGRWLR